MEWMKNIQLKLSYSFLVEGFSTQTESRSVRSSWSHRRSFFDFTRAETFTQINNSQLINQKTFHESFLVKAEFPEFDCPRRKFKFDILRGDSWCSIELFELRFIRFLLMRSTSILSDLFHLMPFIIVAFRFNDNQYDSNLTFFVSI